MTNNEPATARPTEEPASDWRKHLPALKECFDRVPEQPWIWRQRHDAPWLEISEDAWMEALEILPAMQWMRGPGPETFMIMELSADGERGAITECFARSMGKYYMTMIYVEAYNKARARVPPEGRYAHLLG